MSRASRFDAGPMESWKELRFSAPFLPRPTRGKFLLGEPLSLSGMEVSLNVFPPGASMPFSHRHRKHEELYIFLSGRGQMRVDEETLEIVPGTCIRVAPEGARIWRNTGSEPLYFIVVQALEGTGVRGIEDGEPAPVPADWATRPPL